MVVEIRQLNRQTRIKTNGSMINMSLTMNIVIKMIETGKMNAPIIDVIIVEKAGGKKTAMTVTDF